MTPKSHDTVFDFDFSITYVQEADTGSENRDDNRLKVYSCGGGGGPYFVMETQRWAFNSVGELMETLKALQGIIPDNH